jgi:hypothetical protein
LSHYAFTVGVLVAAIQEATRQLATAVTAAMVIIPEAQVTLLAIIIVVATAEAEAGEGNYCSEQSWFELLERVGLAQPASSSREL